MQRFEDTEIKRKARSREGCSGFSSLDTRYWMLDTGCVENMNFTKIEPIPLGIEYE
jgi:hypothetical protein